MGWTDRGRERQTDVQRDEWISYELITQDGWLVGWIDYYHDYYERDKRSLQREERQKWTGKKRSKKEGLLESLPQLREVFEPTYCKCKIWPSYAFISLQKYTVSLLEEHASILYIMYEVTFHSQRSFFAMICFIYQR